MTASALSVAVRLDGQALLTEGDAQLASLGYEQLASLLHALIDAHGTQRYVLRVAVPTTLPGVAAAEKHAAVTAACKQLLTEVDATLLAYKESHQEAPRLERAAALLRKELE